MLPSRDVVSNKQVAVPSLAPYCRLNKTIPADDILSTLSNTPSVSNNHNRSAFGASSFSTNSTAYKRTNMVSSTATVPASRPLTLSAQPEASFATTKNNNRSSSNSQLSHYALAVSRISNSAWTKACFFFALAYLWLLCFLIVTVWTPRPTTYIHIDHPVVLTTTTATTLQSSTSSQQVTVAAAGAATVSATVNSTAAMMIPGTITAGAAVEGAAAPVAAVMGTTTTLLAVPLPQIQQQPQQFNTLSSQGASLPLVAPRAASFMHDESSVATGQADLLCEECLTIAQYAIPIDLAFVPVWVATDTTAQQQQDRDVELYNSHRGALDASGAGGYVANATQFAVPRPQPAVDAPSSSHRDDVLQTAAAIALDWSVRELEQACSVRDDTYTMLHNKVHVVNVATAAPLESSSLSVTTRKTIKLLCIVYTTYPRHDRIPNLLRTWGPKCDGFLAASNVTDPTIGAVNIPHAGPDVYKNIWQKVRNIWSYVYDNYYNDFDWFHIGGDDMYLLVENLKFYLQSDEIQAASNGGLLPPAGYETHHQTPLYLGRRFAYKGDRSDVFNSGGPGYTINKAALKTLVVNGIDHYYTDVATSTEDVMVARIFRQLHVLPYPTRDFTTGGERYMPFSPGDHYRYQMPTSFLRHRSNDNDNDAVVDQKHQQPDDVDTIDGLRWYSEQVSYYWNLLRLSLWAKNKNNRQLDWYAKYALDDIQEGIDHCAAHSVAFHYIQGDDMKRIHALLYGLCPVESFVGTQTTQ